MESKRKIGEELNFLSKKTPKKRKPIKGTIIKKPS